MTRAARFCHVLCLVVAVAQSGLAQAQQSRRHAPLTVGVVLDGHSTFNDSVRVVFEREIIAFFGSERVVEFPARATVEADWSSAGAAAVIDRLFADTGVDLVLALGPIGSNELAHRRALPKPSIAALIVDAPLQGLPNQSGASGVANLSYVNIAYTASRTLQLFHDLVSYRKLAALIHPGLLAALPQLIQHARADAQAIGVSLEFVPVTNSAADALRAVPADVDAIYLTPLDQLPDRGIDSLIQAFTARRLPTFAYTGRAEVERGALASYAPKDDFSRRARRVAGNMQRIKNGENAGTLPVDLAAIAQLTLNMATARAIGYSPDWNTLTEAELINEQPPAAGPTWSLAQVAQEAVRVNLDLRVADRSVASGREDVRIARAGLLPQAQASATGTMIKEQTAAASLGQQAERQSQGQLSFSQVLISDQTWANYAVETHQQAGREANYHRSTLDVTQDATRAYLNVLRAKAIASVERTNIKLTRSNLDLAVLRERTGASSLADVYRWQAELAQGRRSVLGADAQVQVAQLDLNRILNRPLEETFQTEEATVDDPMLITGDPRMFAYFDNPATFRVFRDFMVREGQAASPELRTLDAAIAAEGRVATAARRSFWLPTLTAGGTLSDIFSRGGAGSTPPSLGPITVPRPPDATWSLRLQASIPIFTGLQRVAARAQADIALDRLTLQRQSVDLSISERIRSSLHVAGAAWAGIQQARAAATAAHQNLDLVTDAYSRGAVSIINLIDAQQTALSADEAAANAAYDFLIDLMNVERAVGQFDFFRSPEERQSFYQRLDAFYRAAGVSPSPQ
jgi:outer membrane protein